MPQGVCGAANPPKMARGGGLHPPCIAPLGSDRCCWGQARGTWFGFTSLTERGGAWPLFRVLYGDSDANEAQGFGDRRGSGGGHVERGDGAICLPAGIRAIITAPASRSPAAAPGYPAGPLSGAAAGGAAGAANGGAAAGPVGAIVGGALGTATGAVAGTANTLTGAPRRRRPAAAGYTYYNGGCYPASLAGSAAARAGSAAPLPRRGCTPGCSQ